MRSNGQRIEVKSVVYRSVEVPQVVVSQVREHKIPYVSLNTQGWVVFSGKIVRALTQNVRRRN